MSYQCIYELSAYLVFLSRFLSKELLLSFEFSFDFVTSIQTFHSYMHFIYPRWTTLGLQVVRHLDRVT